MFVPINLLKPILADMLESGRPSGPKRPWLGISSNEAFGRLLVSRVAKGSPAEKAGIRQGDLILGVAGKEVGTLADFYRAIWAMGAAGVTVPITVLQGAQVREIRIESASRYDFLKINRSY
jgi:S1-C subfamily serine protease